MAEAADFTKMLPGFDFLQSIIKNAGAGLPGMNQWIAPTLNPEELEKRIDELRTVQFWLEQNGRMLGVTIQALEVQRLTLTTLKSMNLPLAEIGESLRMKMPAPVAAPAAVAEPEPEPEPAASAPAAPATPAAGAVDPLQWWGALTQQFAELAAKAVKDSGGVAKNMVAAAGVPGAESAGAALKTAVSTKAARAAVPRKRAS